MESELEPAVRTEETPEAFIVEIDLPGFRREELRVQVNSGWNLVISGERGAKEMEERRSEKVQRGGQKFRKVISVPQNLNLDSVTAKFRDGKLRVSLPLLHVSDQRSQETLPGSGKTDQSLQSNVDRSSPAWQQDSRKESAAATKDDQSARHPEAIRQGDDKEKPTVAAEKSNELLDEKKAKAPEQAGEPPISTHAQAVCEDTASAQPTESIQLKSKPDIVQKQLQEDGGRKSGVPPEIRRPLQEKKEEGGSADDGKAAEKDHHVVGKERNGDGVGRIVEGYIRRQQEEKKDDVKCSTCRIDKFPDLKRITFPASCSSTISKRGMLIASTVVVLSVAFYMTYKSRSQHHI